MDLSGSDVALPQPRKWMPTSNKQAVAVAPERVLSATVTTSNSAFIESPVLIKIIKHCTESYPIPVNGLLLGLDEGTGASNGVEISDCFALQTKKDLFSQFSRDKSAVNLEIENKIAVEQQRYQMKTMELLNSVNADCCTVGWYQTMSFEDLRDPALVTGLAGFSPGSVVIGFNPDIANFGVDAFKAFRVTDEVLRCRNEFADKPKRTCGNANNIYNGIKSRDLLVEVPLIVRDSLLVKAFALDCFTKGVECGNPELYKTATKLGLADKQEILSKNLNFIGSTLDELQGEQDKLARTLKDVTRDAHLYREQVEKRNIENEQRRVRNEPALISIPPIKKTSVVPSHLPILLMVKQTNDVSQKVEDLLAENVCRTSLIYHTPASGN